MNRQEFAKALATIKIQEWGGEKGMPGAEVLKILGKPDDVRTRYDPGGINSSRTKEIWCYGTNGHLTFPTLGHVYLDRDGRAQWVCGGRGSPPSERLFKEEELRELLRLIDRVPGWGSTYRPLSVIQIVNALQPLGKEKALAAIDEYLRVAWSIHSQGVLFVLLVLFDVPEPPGHLPRMGWGGFGGEEAPEDPVGARRVPRYPMGLIDDVPLMLSRGWMLRKLESVPEHVEYFRKNGRLRARPLSPPSAPLELLDRFRKEYLWLYKKDRFPSGCRAERMIIDQLLTLVDSVYRTERETDCTKFEVKEEIEKYWQRVTAEFSKLEIRWDEKKNKYVFKNGSTLPEISKPYYRREIWKLEGIPGEAVIAVERDDQDSVYVTLEQSGGRNTESKKGPATGTLYVYATKDQKTKLAQFSIGSIEEGHSRTLPNRLKLKDGDLIQLEWEIGQESKFSPAYKP